MPALLSALRLKSSLGDAVSIMKQIPIFIRSPPEETEVLFSIWYNDIRGTNISNLLTILTDPDIVLVPLALDAERFPGLDSSIRVHDGFKDAQASGASCQVNVWIYFRDDGRPFSWNISLIDSVYLPLHLPSGITFKTIAYGLLRLALHSRVLKEGEETGERLEKYAADPFGILSNPFRNGHLCLHYLVGKKSGNLRTTSIVFRELHNPWDSSSLHDMVLS
ncbi:hypothetical protein EDD15DRAFT_2205838 [Pisolithus albus]|nr:hypothetical protein EDD15DRAFT_2205838 [Pisolithus albus]